MWAKNYFIFTVAAVLSLILLAQIPRSQNLGQSAGGLVFNVSLGSSQSMGYTVFDGGSAAISYTVTPPQYNQIANETTPIVTVTPLSGTLQPGQQAGITVMVHMPASNKPGIKWDGIMQVLATTNASNPGGAVIQGGLGKEVVIYSSLPPRASLGFLVYVIIGVVVAVVIIGGVLFLFKGKGGKTKAAKPKYKYVTVKKRVRVK